MTIHTSAPATGRTAHNVGSCQRLDHAARIIMTVATVTRDVGNSPGTGCTAPPRLGRTSVSRAVTRVTRAGRTDHIRIGKGHRSGDMAAQRLAVVAIGTVGQTRTVYRAGVSRVALAHRRRRMTRGTLGSAGNTPCRGSNRSACAIVMTITGRTRRVSRSVRCPRRTVVTGPGTGKGKVDGPVHMAR